MLAGLRGALCACMVALLATRSLAVAGMPCAAPELQKLRSSVKQNFRKWDVVTIESLSSDDASIWRSNWGSDCPGISSGNFDGTGRTQYAVLMTSKSGRSGGSSDGHVRQMRLVHAAAGSGFTYRLLDRGPAAIVPVVRSLPPGTYYYFKPGSDSRSPIKTANDLVLLEVIEASSFAYQVKTSQVRQFMLSF